LRVYREEDGHKIENESNSSLIIDCIIACFPATAGSIYGQQATQEESEGDLEVVLNGEVFTTGQTITISGSVDDPRDQPVLNIEVVDPEGGVVERASPEITADDTFTFSFEAGKPDPSMLGDKPMTVSGNYRVTVTYLPSSQVLMKSILNLSIL
jgi:hypothetical protein